MFDSIQEAYISASKDVSDINEHINTLLYYSRKCSHVTEFGVRTGVSTAAFLFGLENNHKFVGYDIVSMPEAQHLFDLAKKEGKNTEYIIRDVLDPELEIEPTEFLFIDTWHTFKQLKTELEKHSHSVSRFIAFHDTVSFGKTDEILPGYEEGEHKGLLMAIDQFLILNPEWKILEQHENNNGLLILENVNAYVPQADSYIPKNIENPTETDTLNQKIHSEVLDDAFGDNE